jgi:hypothetical protein
MGYRCYGGHSGRELRSHLRIGRAPQCSGDLLPERALSSDDPVVLHLRGDSPIAFTGTDIVNNHKAMENTEPSSTR